MHLLLFLFSLLISLASAQDYSGTYVAQEDSSVALTLTQEADGTLRGSFAGPIGQLQLEGMVAAEGVVGVVYLPEVIIGFEAYLQGEMLSFYLFEFGPDLQPIKETVTGLLMLRQASGVAPAPPGPIDHQHHTSSLDLTPLRATTLTGTPLALNQQYSTGTELLSRAAGASFVVPQGFRAVTAEGLVHPVLQNDSRFTYAIVGMQSGFGLSQLQTMLLEEQEIEGDTLRPVGTPQLQEAQLIQPYAGTQTLAYLGAVLGEAGNGVLVFLYGPRYEDGYLRSTLEALLASVRLGTPEASAEVQRLRQELPGMKLRWFTSSEGVTASREYHLCRDGTYSYEYDYVLALQGGGQIERNRHQGRWRLEAGGIGTVLVMDVSDGRVLDVALYQAGGETYVNQTRHYLVPSDRCR